MPKKKSTEKPEEKVPDGVSLQILTKEYDSLRDMYNQAVQNGQTMFNYYLTLMTAVFGGITFVSQPSSGIFLLRTTIGLLLVFLALIGSLYLSSLSTNFAHATRYAKGANDLRKFIIARHDVVMPPVYTRFMGQSSDEEESKWLTFVSFLVPVHTYQLFTAIISSLAWASAIALTYYASNVSVQLFEIIVRGGLAFIITYLIYSVYARYIYRLTISRSNIAIGY